MENFKLRIELLNTEPLIWRRFVVAENIALPKLHKIIQAVMGWKGNYGHCFEFNGARYGIPDESGEMDMEDEKNMKLDIVLNDAKEFDYIYNFSENWLHRLVVESIDQQDPLMHIPACLAGENACPPEDVGGRHGYEKFLAALANPKDKGHDDCLRWIGGVFDPDGFDVNAVNDRMSRMRK